VTRLREEGIPFDGLVLDFAWHNYGWDGGFDWSPLVPHPKQLIDWLHGQGIKLSLNDHPGYANTEESMVVTTTATHRRARCARSAVAAKAVVRKGVIGPLAVRRRSERSGYDQQWFAAGHRRALESIKAGLSWERRDMARCRA
jgi:hypothetical protein